MHRILLLAFMLSISISAHANAASESVRCVQNELNDLGYDAGAADGLLGRKTIAAGDKYIAYMKSKNDGWNMPRLAKDNSDHWCKQVANANGRVAKYYEAMLAASGASTLSVTDVRVDRELKAGVPYPVELTFAASGGGGPINIDGACFYWSEEGPICSGVEPAGPNKVRVNLVTGNPNTYRLNAGLQYTSGGRQYMTNWYTNEIVVSR